MADASTPTLHAIATAAGLRIDAQGWARLQILVTQRRQQLGLDSDHDYLDLLHAEDKRRHAEFEALSAAFSSFETYFMRDAGQIALLRDVILPELIARGQHTLRVWSCGCSSGEEAFTLAIVLDQLIADPECWGLTVIGTDISGEALDKARRARYGEWSFRGCAAELRAGYFTPTDDGRWQPIPRIRAMVDFQRCDLVHDALPAPERNLLAFDLIVCRNVFIYLNPDAVQQALRKLTDCLAPGGVLLTGHGELLGPQRAGLRQELHPQSVVWRRTEGAPAPTPSAGRPAGTHPVAPHMVIAPAATPAPHAQPVLGSEPPVPDLQQAWSLANTGHTEQARRVCTMLLRDHSLDPQLHYLRALLELESGQLDAARDALRRAIYLDPDQVAAYIQLAEIDRAQARPHEAQRNLAAAVRQLSDMAADAAVDGLPGTTAGQVLADLQARLRGAGAD